MAESKAGRSITPSSHKSGALPTAFPINLKSNSKAFIFLMMDSDDLFYEKIILKSIPKYQRDLSIRTFTEGAIHGLLLIATIIAFVLFLITRLSINLYYFLYVAVNTFSLHIALGYFNYLFFPEFAFGHIAQFAAVLISSILFFKFILTYYEGYGLSPKFEYAFWIYTVPTLLFLIIMFRNVYLGSPGNHPEIIERLPMIWLSLMSLISYILIFYFVLKKPTWSNFMFAFAFFLMLYFSVVTVLFRNGFLSEKLYPPLAYEIAMVVEFFFLTFLVAHKVVHAYKENAVMHISLKAQEKELAQAAVIKKAHEEKDTLLREIHHRVKNNLQVISALLTLQSSHLKDVQAKTALQEGQDRVQSMALIHKDLYHQDNLKGVNTKIYLENLIQNLFHSYKINDDEIVLHLNIEDISLDVETMIPLGLMVNELISNALKHAFTNKTNGELRITLKELDQKIQLTISDNGHGLEDISLLERKSFGYSLIKSFAKKLDAEIDVRNKQGLEINILIKNYEKV